MVRVCDKCKVEFIRESDIVVCDLNKGQDIFDLCEKCAGNVVTYIRQQKKKGWFN